MNKTVNINLAGTFFHIDEDAYLKLQHYLEAIKRSFTDSQGRNEIIADIEARIAELFNERVKNERHVIGIKEVDEVISVMGQPEDYLVDDEIFEDEPQPSYERKAYGSKKLFRDTDNSYVGGVSSGLGHYFGIDPLWIRLIWVILLFGFGTGVPVYIILWILVPEAKTTAEKIMMTGDPVNISNIEKKIKDGFDTVSETVSGVAKNVSDSVSGAAKNVQNAANKTNFHKQGNNIKSSSRSFFDFIADFIMLFFKIIAKIVGVVLIIVSATTLISLIIGWFSVGIADTVNIPGIDFVNVALTDNAPIWLASLLVFFVIGIPFFFLFYLGLKILINNLKSIGNFAKFTLLGLWLCAIIALVVMGIKEASEHSYNERTVEKQELFITTKDTLIVKMAENDLVSNYKRSHNSYKIKNNDKGEKTIYNSDIEIIIKPTTDTIASISIEKSADGSNVDKAILRAKNIHYNYTFNSNELILAPYLSTLSKNKFSDQEVLIVLNLPLDMIIKFENNTSRYLSRNIPTNYTNHFLKVSEDGVICYDCEEEDYDVNIDMPSIKINENGIEIKADKNHLKIDNKGINAVSEDVKVNINSDGINIKSDK